MKTSTGPWMFEITAKYKMQSSNGNKHWSGTTEARAQWRRDACNAAHKLRMPQGLTRIRVDIELVFPWKAKRDAPNYYQEIGKRIVDGLGPQRIVKGKNPRVEHGHGVVPDDTEKQVYGPHIIISEELADPAKHPFGYAVVTVTDLSTPPAMPESGPGWEVVIWKDPQGKRWYHRWADPKQWVDAGAHSGTEPIIFDSREELEAAHGPLTPHGVDDTTALLAELHRTQMLLAGYLTGGAA